MKRLSKEAKALLITDLIAWCVGVLWWNRAERMWDEVNEYRISWSGQQDPFGMTVGGVLDRLGGTRLATTVRETVEVWNDDASKIAQERIARSDRWTASALLKLRDCVDAVCEKRDMSYSPDDVIKAASEYTKMVGASEMLHRMS